MAFEWNTFFASLPLPIPIVLLAAVIAAVVFIIVSYKGTAGASVAAKTIASLLFVTLGLLCFLHSKRSSYALLVMVALVFGLFGDVFLELQPVFSKKKNLFFLLGLSAFFIGHVFYVVAFLKIAPFTILHPIVFAATFCVALLLKAIFKVDPQKMLPPVLAYLTVISLMVAAAFGVAFSNGLSPQNPIRVMLPLSALLFLISDAVLAYIYYGKTKAKPLVAINLSTYYAAQILLALTILFV